MRIFIKKRIFLMALSSLIALSLSPAFAHASALHFSCELIDDPSTKVTVETEGKLFNNPEVESVIAKIQLIKSGQVVESAVNAMIGDRTPIFWPEDLPGVTWAMNVKMGRQGTFQMGYDPVADGWYLAVKSLHLYIESQVNNANCSVFGESGILH